MEHLLQASRSAFSRFQAVAKVHLIWPLPFPQIVIQGKRRLSLAICCATVLILLSTIVFSAPDGEDMIFVSDQTLLKAMSAHMNYTHGVKLERQRTISGENHQHHLALKGTSRLYSMGINPTPTM
ncbi:hypothetical protein K443DRAFT_677546 [Laccaria amethystina LaAM-08-1]|uniref:Uncharacterized protein n=1 Tax=Laccaria amethystina LaAM-08-1 TaxID=1095629 RepID=A0A0C9WTS5_9AGAR|nr:hypothetical protein K443DRAFT_677546 [Laccaria amethystina LaAM-08-1]